MYASWLLLWTSVNLLNILPVKNWKIPTPPIANMFSKVTHLPVKFSGEKLRPWAIINGYDIPKNPRVQNKNTATLNEISLNNAKLIEFKKKLDKNIGDDNKNDDNKNDNNKNDNKPNVKDVDMKM